MNMRRITPIIAVCIAVLIVIVALSIHFDVFGLK